MKKCIKSSSNTVKYYEVDFNNGYGMVIKSKIEPTREQIEEFVKVDADKNGGVAEIYGPSTREEVSPFYDMENESNWPILESTSIKCSEISDESSSKLSSGDSKEMSDIIFDTLFGNTQFPQFDPDLCTEIDDETGDTQYVDRGKSEIVFGYMGHVYKVKVSCIN